MEALAVVLERPELLTLQRLALVEPTSTDVVVAVEWTGISTGTERLLWSGRMPAFPGMGYPLVPGYESVGTIVDAGADSGRVVGQRVFLAGSHSFVAARSLFGGAASHLIVPGHKAIAISPTLDNRAILLALAATAHHAIGGGARRPDLIVGHGVLGRLLARLAVALGDDHPVTVWETNPARRLSAQGYTVCHPDDDTRRDYRAIYDVSGDASLLNALVQRLTPGGEIVLAGFYTDDISFAFAPAFQREARLRIAAEWKPGDLETVATLVDRDVLSLADLITHASPATDAASAYERAFTDATCVKMVLDWRACA